MFITLKHHLIAFLGCVLGVFSVVCFGAYELMLGVEVDYDKLIAGIGTVVGTYIAGILTTKYRFKRIIETGEVISNKQKSTSIYLYLGVAYIWSVVIFGYLFISFFINI
jgi:hypothetical protein